MYHWLELHLSIPKTIPCKGNRITMIALEKHWSHAERSRLSSKWSSAKKKKKKEAFCLFGRMLHGGWTISEGAVGFP